MLCRLIREFSTRGPSITSAATRPWPCAITPHPHQPRRQIPHRIRTTPSGLDKSRINKPSTTCAQPQPSKSTNRSYRSQRCLEAEQQRVVQRHRPSYWKADRVPVRLSKRTLIWLFIVECGWRHLGPLRCCTFPLPPPISRSSSSCPSSCSSAPGCWFGPSHTPSARSAQRPTRAPRPP